jgi:hypothetical protein
MNEPNAQEREKHEFRVMTPAHVREPPAADYVYVLFLESPRFYRLFKRVPAFDRFVSLVRDAVEKKRAVRIRFTSPHGDVIEEINES